MNRSALSATLAVLGITDGKRDSAVAATTGSMPTADGAAGMKAAVSEVIDWAAIAAEQNVRMGFNEDGTIPTHAHSRSRIIGGKNCSSLGSIWDEVVAEHNSALQKKYKPASGAVQQAEHAKAAVSDQIDWDALAAEQNKQAAAVNSRFVVPGGNRP